MLRIEAVNVHGQRFELCPCNKAVIRQEAGVPADIFEGDFPYVISEELGFLYVYSNGTLLFEGVVDEQISTCSQRENTQVVARSFAALLLDNEAMPQSFVNPSFEVIFKRYFEPLGFEKFEGENVNLSGEFKVTKGMSCYKVLKNFVSKAGCDLPFIKGRVIDLRGNKSGSVAEFSDKESLGSFRYKSFKERLKRCELLSEIRVRTGEQSLYSVTVSDEDCINRGVVRIRYLNASMQGGLYKKTAQGMIDKARQKEYSLELECDSLVWGVLSCGARVTRGDRVYENLSVGEVTYTFCKNGENTRITLLRL